MKTVLIVDDSTTVRQYYREILSDSGYEVSEAVNGIEALEKTLTSPFDLYLVDVNMPKMNGYAFLRKLRSEEIPQAPAIMISTEAESQDRDEAFRAGANYYLVKPTKPETLLKLVRVLLGELFT